MERLRLGQITSAVGLKGQVRVYPYTDYKEKFEEIEYVLIGEKEHSIEHVRYNKNMVILKLEGINDRDTAEKHKGVMLYIKKDDAPALNENTYYIKDLLGLDVYDENDRMLGKIKDVIKNPAQDVYEVELLDGEGTFLVPAVDEFILYVDLEERRIQMRIIEGLI